TQRSPQQTGLRGRIGTFRLVAAAIVVLFPPSVGVALSVPSTPPKTQPRRVTLAERLDAKNRASAALWVAGNVSRDAVISCDQQMCAALATHGFPTNNLRVLGNTSPYPLSSNLVIETASVRNLFGRSLALLYAPMALTRLGSGAQEVDVRVMSHNAAAYQRQLAADLQ